MPIPSGITEILDAILSLDTQARANLLDMLRQEICLECCRDTGPGTHCSCANDE